MIALRVRMRLAQPWLPFPPPAQIPRRAQPSAYCARCALEHLERPRPYFVVLTQLGLERWVCEGCLRGRPGPP